MMKNSMQYTMRHQRRLPCVLGAGLAAVVMLGPPALQSSICADVPQLNESNSTLLAVNTPSSGGNAISGDAVTDSRVSLSLRDAPVAHMLSLLSSMTGVNFRYATPPDGTITATFNDAPLVPTLKAWLGAIGFDLRRANSEFFLFRDVLPQPVLPGARRAPNAAQAASRSSGNTGPVPPTWQYWSRSTQPPSGWRIAATGGPATGFEAPAHSGSSAGWRPAAHNIMAELRPGIAVVVPTRSGPTHNGATSMSYLRCILPLKFVPRGAQLMVETPAEATLYVNGAAIGRRWKGRRIVDLSRVLSPGHNCLAIQWSPQRSIMTRGKAGSTSAALLRYEWFFAGDAD